MTTLRMFQCDAFSDELFRGNPGAVVICDDTWLPEKTMQDIAGENNLAETSFVLNKNGDWYVRYFTPKAEIDLCGHVTMCTAHVIFKHLGFDGPKLVLHTHLAGDVTVARDGRRYVMNFPSWVPKDLLDAQRDELAACLRIDPSDILYTGKYRDFLVVLPTETAVRDLRPDFSRMKGLNDFVCVTAKSDDGHFVSRFFTPTDGIDEDPVTGSAHCMLIPYWSKQLDKSEFVARQLSERGGVLYCRDLGERVEIAGSAVTFLDGVIYLSG